MTESATLAVKHGAALLDQHVPGWRTDINPFHLRIADENLCVLGQLFGCFDNGANALGLHAASIVEMGFDSLADCVPGEHLSYIELDDAWKAELTGA